MTQLSLFVIQHSETIPVCFIAMKAGLWRELTRKAKDSVDLIDKFDPYFNLWTKLYGSWAFDQIILSR